MFPPIENRNNPGQPDTKYLIPTVMSQSSFKEGSFGRLYFPNELEGRARRIDLDQPLHTYSPFSSYTTLRFPEHYATSLSASGILTLKDLLDANPQELELRGMRKTLLGKLTSVIKGYFENCEIGPEGNLIADILHQPGGLDYRLVPIKYDEIRNIHTRKGISGISASENEKEILMYRYGIVDGNPRSIKQLVKQFGISDDRVRKIVYRCLNKLRDPSISRQLFLYTHLPVFSFARKAFGAVIHAQINEFTNMDDKTIGDLLLKPTSRAKLDKRFYPDSMTLRYFLIYEDGEIIPEEVQFEMVKSLARQFPYTGN